MKKLALIIAGGVAVASLATACNKTNTKDDSDSVIQDITIASDTASTSTQAVADVAMPASREEMGRWFADPKNEKDSVGYKTTESGLKYLTLKEGTGRRPAATDEVSVHYTGYLVNGQVFDSSVERGEPTEFPLNQVIAGWTEGLQLMKEGGKTVFYIPSELGYGSRDLGIIPPNSDLIFEVELLKVK